MSSSSSEMLLQPDHLSEFSDSVANIVASLLQEQLAPILETLQGHARLLDCHTALLNHSTVINRYNVGKLDDLRDLQTSVNYKLQFHIDPENRQYPTYRFQRDAEDVRRTATVTDIASSTSKGDPYLLGRDSGASCEPSSDLTGSRSGSSTMSASKPSTGQSTPATEPTNNPPLPSPQAVRGDHSARGLRRERPHDEVPDQMWNSSHEIVLSAPLPAPAPALPYIPPPDDNTAMHGDTEDANTKRQSLTQSVPRNTSSRASLRISAKKKSTPHNLRPIFSPLATGATDPDRLRGDSARASSSTQLSDKAAGKKRKSDDDGPEQDQPTTSSGTDSGSYSKCDEPEHKRMKKDTRISTERLPIPESLLTLTRMNLFGEPSFEERRYEVEQLRHMKKLFRGPST
ncbi:hypothetical protein B0F90DRAFT_1666492 [Multifurca ochricompacta]|uniref:Uncharacterized protein n=1 Tax=Multifurca ochricompacta TaxID=376703 RepID=A0AAD4QQZ1_9AGAM|nr:hypothetical protein B0F90DRAFT_1666492 [Multifurca ochricompacta]